MHLVLRPRQPKHPQCQVALSRFRCRNIEGAIIEKVMWGLFTDALVICRRVLIRVLDQHSVAQEIVSISARNGSNLTRGPPPFEYYWNPRRGEQLRWIRYVSYGRDDATVNDLEGGYSAFTPDGRWNYSTLQPETPIT